MRDRYEKYGLDGFEPHEVLEMLLFRSVTRGNTNPTAHDLLDTCGSMEAVLEGKQPVHGAGEKTLAMLRETGNNLDTLFIRSLQKAKKIGLSQLYTAAVRCLRRNPAGVFVMITGRDGKFMEMTQIPGSSPEQILAILEKEMEEDQLCHIACIADGDSLRPLRKQYGRTILGGLLCLSRDWKPVWL